MPVKWAIQVTYRNGEQAWLRHGSRIGEGPIATFSTRKLAEVNADFIKQGMDEGEAVAIVQHRKGDNAD